MKIYYRVQDYLHIRFDYNKNYINVMKSFKGRWNSATKEWIIQLGLDNSASLKRFLSDNGFVMSRPKEDECAIDLKPIEKITDKETIKEALDYLDYPIKLRNYQIEALEYIINRGNCINGSDMGTGKTLISIAYAELLNLFPCIVICPSTVKRGWMKEWNKFNPKRTVHIIDSEDSENVDWKSDVTIINYDFLFKRNSKELKLRYARSLSKKWMLVVLDEIHLCKNEKSLRSRAVKIIAKKAVKVLALSGTVVMNRPKELVNILEIIGKLKSIFKDKWFFLQRYCDAKKTTFGWDFNGASNTLELNKILRHYCYFRKEKRDILKELPSIVKTTIDCEITNKTAYNRAETNFIDYLQSIDIEKAERAQRAENLVRLTYLKELSVMGKLKFIEKFIKEMQEANDELKLIVFGIRTEPLRELSKVIKNSVLITGELCTDEKMRRIDQFKNDKQILLANINTLSTGVDGLQEVCNNMAFIELPPRPSDLEQAIARLERMGQKNSVNVYFLLSQETIDVESKEVLDEKTIVTDAVNKGVLNTEIGNTEDTNILLMKKLKKK